MGPMELTDWPTGRTTNQPTPRPTDTPTDTLTDRKDISGVPRKMDTVTAGVLGEGSGKMNIDTAEIFYINPYINLRIVNASYINHFNPCDSM